LKVETKSDKKDALGKPVKPIVTIWLGVRAGNWEARIRTKDESYPNFRQVIPHFPADFQTHKIIFTDSDAATYGTILSSFPEGNSLAISFSGGDGASIHNPTPLKIQAKGENGIVSVTLSGGSMYVGDDLVSLNRYFVKDALDAGFREFSFVDAYSPLLSTDNKGSTHVLMPMKPEIVKEKTPETEKMEATETSEVKEPQTQAA
jgi:DNA polymerase III sliding clamp (beta) subunit (PCNA family)